MNQLFFGDNLDVLRESIKDESIDLIYLDPPFNSKANYNILFSTPNGHESDAQITAFEDTWHWGEQAEREYSEILHQENTQVAEMITAFRQFLGTNDMMAYLSMMALRLLELHRVLKSNGNIFIHCDPTASHYLKILMDAIFRPRNFRNEIIWHYKRWPAKQRNFQRMHDVILFYSKQHLNNHFNIILEQLSKGTLKRWRGKKSKVEFDGDIRLVTQMTDEDSLGRPMDDVWDIPTINSQAKERLGYPTQKPEALLERIIEAGSNKGDVVLDPFCGCGTAVVVAQRLKRNWIGIDITHLAISLIEKRLKDSFKDIKYEVHGTPKDIDGARDLAKRDKYQFQWWACSLVDAQPYMGKKKGADTGIDGLIFFQDDRTIAKKIIVSVKGGHIGVSMIRDLGHVIDREKAEIGFFVTLTEPTKPMKEEAAKAGFYNSPITDKNFPKIQILTIEGLMNGSENPRYPDLSMGGHTFKKAPAAHKKIKQDFMPFE